MFNLFRKKKTYSIVFIGVSGVAYDNRYFTVKIYEGTEYICRVNGNNYFLVEELKEIKVF